MTAQLHIVSDDENGRAVAIEAWLASYPSATSSRSMASALRTVVRTANGVGREDSVDVPSFEWELLADLQYLEEIRDMLVSRYGRQHAMKYVIAMRSLLRYLARTGLADYATVQRTLTENKVKEIRSYGPPLSFTTNDLWTLLRQCFSDPSPVKGSRDLALISLAMSTGARRSELVGAPISDLDLVNRFITFDAKGGGRRRAAVHLATKEHLEQWLEHRGDGPGPLFPGLRKGGHITDQQLSDHQLWKMLRQRCEAAGIEPVIAPHDLRRWFVTTLLEGGTDVIQVARVVDHKRLATTLRYDRRPETRLRDVVDGLSLPAIADLEGPTDEPTHEADG